MRLAGVVRIALLALIWGSGFLLIKTCLRSFSPIQLTVGRLALGAVVLLIFLAIRRLRLPSGRLLWRHLLVAALLANAIPYTLFGIAEQSVNSNVAGAINATTPLWTVLFAVATRSEARPSSRQWLGILLGFAGSLLILTPWKADGPPVPGSIACLVASATYGASYVYMGRFLTGRGTPPLVLSAAQLLGAAGWLILAVPFGGLTVPQLHAVAVVALLVLGGVGTGVAYVLNYRILSDDGPILASTVTYLIPVVAVVLGLLVLDEGVTAQLVLGVVVVLIGVALTRRADRRGSQNHPVLGVSPPAEGETPRKR